MQTPRNESGSALKNKQTCSLFSFILNLNNGLQMSYQLIRNTHCKYKQLFTVVTPISQFPL